MRSTRIWVASVLTGCLGLAVFETFIKAQAPPAAAQPTAPMAAPSPLPRPWRWTLESEWVAHQIVREIASWTLLAHPGAPATQLHVRRTAAEGAGTFEVEITGLPKLALRPAPHVWAPAAYVTVARALVPSSAPPAGEPAKGVADLLLAADTASLQRADTAVFTELRARPIDARLHEQAALLWAAHALRESNGGFVDDRPFLNGIAAHLALAAALRNGVAQSADGAIAAAVLDARLGRQVDAMAALDRIAAPEGDAATRAWVTAVRLHVTHDPRLIPEGPRPSRLVQLQGVRALQLSRGCASAVRQARGWGLAPAAEWLRDVAGGCNEPERSQLLNVDLDVQTRDAAQTVGLRAADPGAVLEALQTASAANTHQPGPPDAIVPQPVRADAAVTHIVSALDRNAHYLSLLGRAEQVKVLEVATAPLVTRLTVRPLLESDLERVGGYRSDARVCERFARLIADRPDLVTQWSFAKGCRSQTLLNMVAQMDFEVDSVVPGTARVGGKVWQGRSGEKGDLAAAAALAPWDARRAAYALHSRPIGEPSSTEVKKAYERLVEYDLNAMRGVIQGVHDDDDEVQRLAERMCAIDVEECGGQADYLAAIDRNDAALRMWKRALAEARDEITLSNELGRYVLLLLDRGQTAEALRVANRVGDVYSHVGLLTLATAYERLGRYDDAAHVYRNLTERYGDKGRENTFYIRYRQRHGDDRFQQEAAMAMAEVFPKGLRKASLADFLQKGRQGASALSRSTLPEHWRRAGLRPGDFVVAVDGFVVENDAQMDAILTFTDDPAFSAIVYRVNGLDPTQGFYKYSFVEVKGTYHRWKYGPAGTKQ
jgi:tetratricopeptide (TPR) repeat protein